MLVKIHKASDVEYEQVIEINSIQDLKDIQDWYNNSLIIDFYAYDYKQECDYVEVLVYDYYVE